MQVLQTLGVVVAEAIRVAQLVSLPLLSVAQVRPYPSCTATKNLIVCILAHYGPLSAGIQI